VGNVNASSAFKEIVIEYDGKATSPEALAKLLVAAGYPPATGLAGDDGKVVYGEFDAMWRERGTRVTVTDARDLAMSGDFRRY
jgi:hypothetical protein